MVKAPKKAQVSSLGRFRSTQGVVSTPAPRPSGYVHVKIGKKNHAIHRLMAVAFELPRTPEQTTVNHKDGITDHNLLSNLEWASPAEQVRHSFSTNKNRRSCAPRLSKPVRGRKVGDAAWTAYDSAEDAARKLGVNSGSVSACCSGKRKQTGGYEFELATPTEPELLPGEEWRTVAGTSAKVSSLGRFRSTAGVVGTPAIQKDGYARVMIGKKKHLIHRQKSRFCFHSLIERSRLRLERDS